MRPLQVGQAVNLPGNYTLSHIFGVLGIVEFNPFAVFHPACNASTSTMKPPFALEALALVFGIVGSAALLAVLLLDGVQW